MKISKYLVLFLITSIITTFAQEINKGKENTSIKNSSKSTESAQAVEGDIIFSDGTNNLLRITDEGTTGALQFQDGVPTDVTNKLYNNGGSLYFNGTDISSSGASSLNDLSDAIHDGTNLFLGIDAGINNSGFWNVGVGYNALIMNDSGERNTALGSYSLFENTSGIFNVGLGYQASYKNTTGENNISIGYSSNYHNLSGSNNTIIGHEAGQGDINEHSKSGSVFLGYRAGFYELTSNKLYIDNSDTVAPLIWGDFTEDSIKINGDFHVTGNITSDGTSVLVSEINDLTDAQYDGESLFIGENAGLNDDSGASDGIKNFNVGVGKNALTSNTTGKSNSSLGAGSLKNNISGNFNVAVGTSAQNYNETGSYNTSIGLGANSYNVDGSNNTMVGYFAGHGSNISSYPGSGNVFLGYRAGYSSLGDDKLYIENSDSETPLIYGDFADDSVKVNGILSVTKNLDIGENNYSTINSIVVGKDNNSQGLESIAVGVSNFTFGFQSAAFGVGLRTLHYLTTAVGRYNAGGDETNPNNLDWNEDDPLFEIGNGTDASNRSNAMTVLKNGNTFINGKLTVNGKAAIGETANASGTNSFAIGSNVNASADGSFFLGDNSASTPQATSTANRFAARFDGGYRFYTTSDLSVGAKMNNGDNGWTSVSDSTKKTNFKAVNGEEILSKISKFNLVSWNYKTQDPQKHRHYGPMAQDFFEAFGHDGIGNIGTDTTLSSTDFDGINFIAIQALEKRTAKQDERIRNQEKRIEELERLNSELVKMNSEYKTQNAEVISINNDLISEINKIKETISAIVKQKDNKHHAKLVSTNEY